MARRRPQTTTQQLAQLSLDAPFVIGQRLLRMAATAHAPSAKDRREFNQMGLEKWMALQEGSFAMGVAVLQAQQRAWLAAMGMAWPPWSQPWHDIETIAAAALQPATRRAAANARRLSKAGRRRNQPG